MDTTGEHNLCLAEIARLRRQYDDALGIAQKAAEEATATYEANKGKGSGTSAFDQRSIGEVWGAKKALDALAERLEQHRLTRT